MPYLVPIVDRSGPTHCPCPWTRWQLAHEFSPVRKKTARPLSGSPSRRISSPNGGSGRPGGHLGQGQDRWPPRRGPGGRGEVVCRSVVASVFRSSGSLPAFASSRIRRAPPSSWARVRRASRRRPSGNSRASISSLSRSRRRRRACGSVRTAASATGLELGWPLVPPIRRSRSVWLVGEPMVPSASTAATRTGRASARILGDESRGRRRSGRRGWPRPARCPGAEFRVVEGLLERRLDRRIVLARRSTGPRACVPGVASSSRLRTRVLGLSRPARPATAAARGSLDLAEDVVAGLLQARARSGGQTPWPGTPEPRRGAAARPGPGTCSERWPAGRVSRPDERLVAIDREVRRQAPRRPAVPSRSPGPSGRTACRRRGVPGTRSRASRAPGPGPRDTSGPGRPRRRSAS